jgi:hypothetical protein
VLAKLIPIFGAKHPRPISLRVPQVRFEDSWQGYGYKTDSRHAYALKVSFPGTSVLWKQRTSARRRGKDMVYSGKVTLEATLFYLPRAFSRSLSSSMNSLTSLKSR